MLQLLYRWQHPSQKSWITLRSHNLLLNFVESRAVAQEVSHQLPAAAAAAVGLKPGSGHVEFMVDKAAMGKFSPSISMSPAKHSTYCSKLIIIYHHPGLVQ
jgi:hypothetical protein